MADHYKLEYSITPLTARYSIIHVPVERFRMCSLGKYPYHIFPTLYTTNSLISLARSEITVVQNNPNLALFGQGTLIGFVDTGIDYRHRAFLNIDGTTRLYALWDQTIESGEPPTGFDLGTEYHQTVINQALHEDNPLSIVPSVDEHGHGTMLAGIAAGSRIESANFRGVAPEAELIVVKLAPAKSLNKKIFSVDDSHNCYPESNIMLGIEYLRKTAQMLNRPIVICVGLGSSQGDHSGLGALSMYLSNLSVQPRLSVCIAAGNEGNDRRHYRGEIAGGQAFQEFELRIGERDPSFPLELWQKSPSRLSIEITSPTGERVPNILPRLGECLEQDFLLESTKIYVNNFILEEETGEQLILIRFENALSGIWTIRATSIDNIPSQFDVWLPSGDLISPETYFLVPDPYVTLTSPANSTNSLTVSAYNPVDGSILINSSRGYTSSNTVKPDIAAPGYMLPCPTANNNFGTATGTSAATAHTVGIVAMLMEWAVLKGYYTTITGRDISRLLIRGARRDSSIIYPNPVWGYGQIDVMGVFRSLI